MGCGVPAASSGGTRGAPLLMDEPEEPNQAGGAKPHGNGYWLCQSGLRVHRVDVRIPAVAWWDTCLPLRARTKPKLWEAVNKL